MIYFDERWIGPHGIGRFAGVLFSALQAIPLGLSGNPTSPLDAVRLALALGRLGPDALFLNPGYTAPLWPTGPSVITVHDLNHIDLPYNSSAAKRLYYKHILRPGLHRAAAILTVSHFSRQRIIDWAGVSPTRVHVVGNGVDDNFTPDGPIWPALRPYILAVSNRREHKNERRLLKAFATALSTSGHDLLMTGMPTESLKELAASFGIADRLVFTGSVDESDLPSLYRGAEALFFPSLYEGFGLPLLEAMACGTPCVTSNTTAMPEVAGNAALLVEPTDEQSMAAGLSRILSDEGLRARLAQDGPRQAALFTWQAVVDRTRGVLNQITGSDAA